MVALPAFKFIFLGIRQLTRPVARAIVARANSKQGATYSVCIGLGRVSLGISGVIAEWSREEDRKKIEARKEDARKKAEAEAAKATLDGEGKEKAEGAATGETKSTSGDSGAAPAAAAATAAASSVKPEEKKEAEVMHRLELVSPRSRSLLKDITFGPQPLVKQPDDYDDTIFLDPKRTSGEVARVFIRFPYRSTWDVFRKTFLAPFPEKRLVEAGADLLIELIAYSVLALLLWWELRVQSLATATKEANLQARLDAIEAKVNELALASRADGRVEPLVPVKEQEVLGRLGALWAVASSGAALVAGAFAGEPPRGLQTPPAGEVAAAPAYRKSGNSRLAEAPPPVVMTGKRGQKHDDALQMKKELDLLFNQQKTDDS